MLSRPAVIGLLQSELRRQHIGRLCVSVRRELIWKFGSAGLQSEDQFSFFRPLLRMLAICGRFIHALVEVFKIHAAGAELKVTDDFGLFFIYRLR